MSKQSDLIAMLLDSEEFFTVAEILKKTGLAKSSLNNYLKSYLKKIGYKVEVGEKLGTVAYRINKAE